jgi:hypothetical protein
MRLARNVEGSKHWVIGDTIVPAPATWCHQSVLVTAAAHLVNAGVTKNAGLPWAVW